MEDNELLAFVEFVLVPVATLEGKREFVVDRTRDNLEPLVYTSIEKMQEATRRIWYDKCSALHVG